MMTRIPRRRGRAKATSDKKPTILERVLEHCGRSTRMPLGFLDVGEDVWDCPSDPEQVVHSLTTAFEVDELAASGVVVINQGGSITLTAALSSDRRFIVLRNATTGEPFELLTGDGCVTSSALPIFEVLRDRHTQQCLKQVDAALFVAFDIEDAILLRACGLPATLAIGLDELPLEEIGRFCREFGVSCRTTKRDLSGERHSDDPFGYFAQMGASGAVAERGQVPNDALHDPNDPTGQCQPQLIFLAWKPSDLSNTVSSEFNVVANYFGQLNQHMGLAISDMGMWEPGETVIARLRFLAAHRSAVYFREAVIDASDEIKTYCLWHSRDKSASHCLPLDYPKTLARLEGIGSTNWSSHPQGDDHRVRAWSDFQKALNQQVIYPMREYALSFGDPIEKSLLLAFADLSTVFHMQTALIGEQLGQQISKRGGERNDLLPDSQLKNLLAVADRLINMSQAVNQCTQPHSTSIRANIIDSPTTRRLPHSE